MNFNQDFAAKSFDIIAKMDDDTAIMFTRCVAFDLLSEDIAKNRRTIDRAVMEINHEILRDVSKALEDREDDESKASLAMVEMISKGWDTNYEEKYHRRQPRDRGGRWTDLNISISRGKTKGVKRGDLIRVREGRPDLNLTSAFDRVGEETSTFARKWNERGEAESSLAPLYSRVGAGGRVLRETGVATGNTKMAVAGKAGEWFGQYGPEAEKVVGPHMRRTAYRYRGTERTPDPKLAALNKDTVAAVARQAGISRTEDFTPTMRHEASQRAAINYLRSRIPDKKLAALQEQSGKIPPSEGVIINADGKIITQAVGYMDDHYLPFNLKNLKGLQGGQYVRRRSSGGLTTEDIYTGLISGARSVTVVSRSGIFTVDFEDDFRGGRRFNDKAAGMVNRYAKTLDAIQSKQVQRRSMSAEEKLKIREEVEDEMFGFKPAEVEAEIKRRTDAARSTPTISAGEMEEINRRAAAAAAEGGPMPKGQFSPREWEKVKADPKKRLLAYRADMIEALMAEKEATKWQLDGEGYAAALDALKEQYPYYINDVRYIHNKDPKATALGLSPETDTGYVKPKFNRPAGAMEGYFDESITGAGKRSADTTNYQNLRGRTKAKEAEAETAAEESAEKKSLTASGLKDQVARGHKQVKVNEELKQMVNETTKELDPSDLEQYKTLALAARSETELDKILSNSAQRDKLQKEIDVLIPRLLGQSNNEVLMNLGGRLQARKKTIDALSVTLGNERWDSNKYSGGTSPAQPYLFDGREYEEGQSPEVYQEAWKNLSDQVGRVFKGFGLVPGSDIKSSSTKFGKLFSLSQEALKTKMDQSDAIATVVAALPDASEEQVALIANQIVKTPGASMQRWGQMAELMERARRIEAVAGDALTQAPAAKATIEGSAREIIRRPAVEAKHDTIESLTADVYAAATSGRDEGVKDAYRNIHRGLMKHDQDMLFEGLADLRDADPTGSRVIEDRLHRMGLIPDEFED